MEYFINTVTEDFYRESIEHFDNKIKEYVVNNLKDIGYTFKSDLDFLEFAKDRIKLVSFLQKPNYFEFWLDLETNPIEICSYSNKTYFEINGSTVTAKFETDLVRKLKLLSEPT